MLAITSCTAEKRDEPVQRATWAVEAMYVLDSIGGQALPAAQFRSPRRDRWMEVLAESLWLRRDGSFVARGAYRWIEDGRASRYDRAERGRYTLLSSVVSDGGQLISGDVLLTGKPNESSRLWAKRGGLFLEGSGLPRPPGGTAGLIPRVYRRVTPP